MDARDGSPQHILGYTIRSRTRIYVSYLIPQCLELIVYIIQMTADIAVSYQHFKSGQPLFGWLTLMLVLIPPVLCFVVVITSLEQWTNPTHANKQRFIGYQLMNLFLFPFVAIYRFARRIFWSVEALFHDDDDKERMQCLAKSGECSTCELYHLIQAYAQSAPQIILQLYHMLKQDLFRNYNTTTVQSISLVFSVIDLASITVTYQRFESQKLAGRPYPWSAPSQINSQKQRLIAADRLRVENERKRRESERKISDFPESNKIMENFKLRHSEPMSKSNESIAIDDLDGGTDTDVTQSFIVVHATTSSLITPSNFTDDEKTISNSPKLMKHIQSWGSINAIESCDLIPETPPPPLPDDVRPTVPELRTQASNTSTQATTTIGGSGGRNRLSISANRLSTFKDMLLLNAQMYIKENIPRPPKMLTGRIEDIPNNSSTTTTNNPDTDSTRVLRSSTPIKQPPKDETDFFIPRPRRIVKGIEQDDFVAKFVAFLGWLAFICMRMVALSTFCVFYPRPFFILLGCHYMLMLICLSLESKFQDKLNRTLFYLLLAYVYIFIILEFRIKFKHIRRWYVGFFVVTMAENLVMTFTWWFHQEFESWWFEFMYDGVIYCGIIFSMTLIVYYCILKPKDVVYLLVDEQ